MYFVRRKTPAILGVQFQPSPALKSKSLSMCCERNGEFLELWAFTQCSIPISTVCVPRYYECFFLNFDYFQVVSSPAVKFINDYTVTCSVPRNATEIAETKTRVIFTCNLTAIEVILSYLLHGRSAANLAVCTNTSRKCRRLWRQKLNKPPKCALLNVRQSLRERGRSIELWKRKKRKAFLWKASSRQSLRSTSRSPTELLSLPDVAIQRYLLQELKSLGLQ